MSACEHRYLIAVRAGIFCDACGVPMRYLGDAQWMARPDIPSRLHPSYLKQRESQRTHAHPTPTEPGATLPGGVAPNEGAHPIQRRAARGCRMTPGQVMLTALGATGLLWFGSAIMVWRIVAACTRETLQPPAAVEQPHEPVNCNQLIDDISEYLRQVRREP